MRPFRSWIVRIRAAQGRRDRQRRGRPRVEEEKPSHVTPFDGQLHGIRHRCGRDVHAAADQRLDRLRASHHLGCFDRETFLRVIAERLRHAHREKGDRILVDRESNCLETAGRGANRRTPRARRPTRPLRIGAWSLPRTAAPDTPHQR